MNPMRSLIAAPLVLMLCAAAPLHAQAGGSPTHREAVKRFLEVTNVRQTLEQGIELMLKSQATQAPQMGAYTKVMRDFYNEHMSWAVMEPDYTRVYLETFTEPELRELIKFYESPAGRTLVAKTPLVTAKTSELTTQRLQGLMPELMKRLQAAMGGAP